MHAVMSILKETMINLVEEKSLINTANTLLLELLETKLRTTDAFDTCENNCRPHQDSLAKERAQ